MLKWLENFNNNYATAIATIVAVLLFAGNVIQFLMANKKKNTNSNVKKMLVFY